MANKKLFELELKNEPLTTDKLALGKSGSSYKNITAANLKTWMLKDLPTPATTLNTKVVNIGAYDMNRSSGNAEKEVALGVTRSKIRAVVVNILSNTSGIYTMASPVTQVDTSPQLRSWWRILDTGTNATIKLYSNDRGFFDIGDFNGDGPDGNRGYITVWYVD